MTKKTKWIASFILVVLLACFIGCSDSKTGPGSGGGVIDPPNFDEAEYNVLIGYDDWAAEWEIYIYGDLEEPESAIELIINDIPIPISIYIYECGGYSCKLYHMYGSFYGMNFIPGQSYKIELITRQGSYNANLRIPYAPQFVETPWIFTPNDPFTITWQLQRNSDLQRLVLYSYDYYYDYDYEVFLSSNARSHTVPMYSLPPDCYIYEMTLETINYIFDKKALFASTQYIERNFKGFQYNVPAISVRHRTGELRSPPYRRCLAVDMAIGDRRYGRRWDAVGTNI